MLIRVPAAWPQPLVATIAMIVLAALDLAGAFAAKEAVQRGSAGMAVLGAVLFLALFWVYASSLEVAELSSVTFGWIVLLQVGVVMLDRYRYHVMPARGAWLAIAVLLAAQAYLVLAPSAGSTPEKAEKAAGAVSEPASSAAEGEHERAEGVHHELAQLGRGERADGHPGDEQGLPDRLVSVVGHVSPQRAMTPTAPTTTRA